MNFLQRINHVLHKPVGHAEKGDPIRFWVWSLTAAIVVLVCGPTFIGLAQLIYIIFHRG